MSTRRLSKAVFAMVATPVVLAAAIRMARRERSWTFEQLIEAQRRGSGPPLGPRLARPEWLAATVDLLLPVLPPRRFGPCLRRALLVMDLWSRCGLDPQLHLEIDVETADRPGHAWLTAVAGDGHELRASGPLRSGVVFEL